MMTVIGSSTKASKTNCTKSSKTKSGKSDSNKGCNTESLFFQHAVPDETAGENVFEASSIDKVPILFLPDLGGGTAALTNGEMSMSMPDVGGTAAITIGDDLEAQMVVSNNDFEPLMMSMSLSMPTVEELTRVRIYSDIDTTIEDEDEEENGEGFIDNIKNATDAGTEFLQNVTNKVLDLFNGTETDNEEGVEDDNMTSSAGAVAADHRVCRQITAAVASLIVMVVVVV
jgi:hypothetical protein